MSTIDFGNLNKNIKKVEQSISHENIVERELILNQCLIRLRSEIQQNKEADVMQRAVDKLPFGKLMGRALKSQGGESDGSKKL